MNCEAHEANEFICTGWQPRYSPDYGYYEPGYPRFGEDEKGIRAGVIDVSKSEEAVFLSIELNSAVSLLAGAAALTLSTLF